MDPYSTLSHVRYKTNDQHGGTLLRDGKLMVLLPLSRPNHSKGTREVQEFRVYVELSAFLAFKHLQDRNGQVLPELPSRLAECDFTWTYRHHDTQFSPLQAARELLSYDQQRQTRPKELTEQTEAPVITEGQEENGDEIQEGGSEFASISPTDSNGGGSQIALDSSTTSSTTPTPPDVRPAPTMPNSVSSFRTIPPRTDPPHSPAPRGLRQPQQSQPTPASTIDKEDPQHPFAVLGAARSVVSQAVSVLGGAFNLPQISSSSTASSLDESPFFARTVPTNQGDAQASMVYLSRLGVSHLGVLFLKDSWGRRYEQDIQYYAKLYGIIVYSVAYEEDEDDLNKAVNQLQQFNVRYFMAVISPSSWKPVVQKAYDAGIMGNPDYHWLIGDLVELVGDGFTLDRETEGDIAKALHGTGVVFLHLTPHNAFDQMLSGFANDEELQREFIASHSEPNLLENFTFSASPGRSLFQYLTYDAVVALGITACDTTGLFTSKEFYDQLLKVDFEGVSGRVNLHERTGTRLGSNMQYQVVNMVLDDYLPGATVSGDMTFSADISSLIELSPPNSSEPTIHPVSPFIYHDNTTVPPLGLPPLNAERNLIPRGILAFGLSLAALVMLLSVFYATWVLKNRHSYVIRASQPIFLVQLCVGTFIIAATIIPMSMQEDAPGLDIACMSTPWLLGIGFAVAISALYAKAHRINQLLNSGVAFRRVSIKPYDVMRPFFVLLSIDLVLLTAWTASPWHLSWHRIDAENSYDKFGRSSESYGVCRSNGKLHFLLSVPLILANVIMLLLATWQSYQARNLPSEFSETLYLSYSMVGLMETFIIGMSITFAVINIPPAFFLVSSVLICIGCLSILLPVFIPKFKLRHIDEPRGRQSTIAISAVIARSKDDHTSFVSQRSSYSSHGAAKLESFLHGSNLGSFPQKTSSGKVLHYGSSHTRQSSDPFPSIATRPYGSCHNRQSSYPPPSMASRPYGACHNRQTSDPPPCFANRPYDSQHKRQLSDPYATSIMYTDTTQSLPVHKELKRQSSSSSSCSVESGSFGV